MASCKILQIPSFLNFEREKPSWMLHTMNIDKVQSELPYANFAVSQMKYTCVTLLGIKMRWIWDLCVDKGASAMVKVKYFFRQLADWCTSTSNYFHPSRPLYNFSLATGTSSERLGFIYRPSLGIFLGQVFACGMDILCIVVDYQLPLWIWVNCSGMYFCRWIDLRWLCLFKHWSP